MNRQQAEHILDAFIEMHSAYKTGNRQSVSVDEAYESLREVILDAMTSYKLSTITAPNVIYSQPTPNYIKPIVTCGVGE